MSFLEQLVTDKVINAYQIDALLRKSEQEDMSIDEALESIGISSDQVRKSKSTYYGIAEKKVPDTIPFNILQYIPQDSATYYKFIPLGMSNQTLDVGILDPEDLDAKNALQFIVAKNNLNYNLFIISYQDFLRVIKQYQGLAVNDHEAMSHDDETLQLQDMVGDEESNYSNPTKKLAVSSAGAKNNDQEMLVEDAPITKMVAVIMRNAVEGGASDVHIEHTGDNVKVRFRVDGTLYTSLVLPKNAHSAVVARVKILAKLKLDEKRKPQDGRFPARIDGRKIDFRVSTLPTFFGEKVVIRILDPEKGVKKLEETGLTEEHLKLVRTALERPYGLILITGPTGSGKTTTLYAMLQEIDREKRNVVSLEDPIEYNVSGMNQSQVRPEIGYTFAQGLRSILRQDPDVIMVGEIRDKETAELAIQAALTGHLVFATLHTNNSIGVVPRLVDMGVDPYLIAPTLELALAQRLVKRLCPDAQQEIPIDGGIQVMIQKQFEDLPEQYKTQLPLGKTLYQAQPSQECPSGTKGRIAVFEVFQKDKGLEQIILNKPTEIDIYNYLRQEKGMLTMKEDAIIKCAEGKIPFSEIGTL